MAIRSVNIAELKNNLSACLARVRRGEEVLVRDRDVPIARIVPLRGARTAEEEALVAAGALKPPEAALPGSFWSMPAPRVGTKRLLAALAADRDDD
jgi:prevent-host-death family protein